MITTVKPGRCGLAVSLAAVVIFCGMTIAANAAETEQKEKKQVSRLETLLIESQVTYRYDEKQKIYSFFVPFTTDDGEEVTIKYYAHEIELAPGKPDISVAEIITPIYLMPEKCELPPALLMKIAEVNSNSFMLMWRIGIQGKDFYLFTSFWLRNTDVQEFGDTVGVSYMQIAGINTILEPYKRECKETR